MKKYIIIPDEICFNELTYNQIMLTIYALHQENTVKRNIYHKHKKRFEKDHIKILEKYGDIILYFRNINGMKGNERQRKHLPTYSKMKIETFEKIKEDITMDKRELLIIIELLRLYKITYRRKHTINIYEFLEKIFKSKNMRQYKMKLLKTLDKLKSWEYKDGSTFLKSYEIKENNLTMMLDEKTKR